MVMVKIFSLLAAALAVVLRNRRLAMRSRPLHALVLLTGLLLQEAPGQLDCVDQLCASLVLLFGGLLLVVVAAVLHRDRLLARLLGPLLCLALLRGVLVAVAYEKT